jgi:hypothetical protein
MYGKTLKIFLFLFLPAALFGCRELNSHEQATGTIFRLYTSYRTH